MTLSLGVGIGADRIRVLAVRGGAVAWAGEAELGDARELGATLGELLASAPVPRWPRPSVGVAIGPSLAQLRLVTGLPQVTDERALTQVVRQSGGKYFLRNGKPLVTTKVRVVAPGEVWCAAFEQWVVDAVHSACREARLAVRGIAPAVAVLGRALDEEQFVWRDGDVRVEVQRAGDGSLATVRRSRLSTDLSLASEDAPTTIPPLARIGASAASFADAYGAALLRRNEPLALAPRADAAGPARWRLPLAAAAVCVALAAWAVLPVRAANRAERAALARLARVQAGRAAATQADEGERRVTAALAEVASFDSARYTQTRLLADINRALPVGSAMVSFAVDSAGGRMVALTPRASAMLAPLERVPGVDGVEIVGTVTNGVVAGRPVERVSIRFGVSSGVRRERDRATDGGGR